MRRAAHGAAVAARLCPAAFALALALPLPSPAHAEEGAFSAGAAAGVTLGLARDASTDDARLASPGWAVRLEDGYDATDSLRWILALEAWGAGRGPVTFHAALAPAWAFVSLDRVRAHVYASLGPFFATGLTRSGTFIDAAASLGLGLTWRFGWAWGLSIDLHAVVPFGLHPASDPLLDSKLLAQAGLFTEL